MIIYLLKYLLVYNRGEIKKYAEDSKKIVEIQIHKHKYSMDLKIQMKMVAHKIMMTIKVYPQLKNQADPN